MGTKTTSISYQFSKQELVDALLASEVPNITALDVLDISLNQNDTSYFDVVIASEPPEAI